MKNALPVMILFILLPVYSQLFAQSATATWPLTSSATTSASATGSVTDSAETFGAVFNTVGYSTISSLSVQRITVNPNSTGTSSASAHQNGGYAQFAVLPTVASAFMVTSIALNMGEGNANSSGISIEYSVNSDFSSPTVVAAPAAATAFPAKEVMYPFSYPISGLMVTSGQTLYVRIYGWNGSTTARYLYLNNLVISGTTASSAATVSTTAITNVGSTTATSGGNVTNDGGNTVTERGIVYSTTSNPTTSDTKITDAAGGTGSFVSNITGLAAATTYYVRAYVINSAGTSYGSSVSFTTNPPNAGSVLVVDNGTTVTLKNSKVAVTIDKNSATITNVTYNGQNLLSGGYNGGQLYWSWNMPNYQNPSGCTYSLTVDPHNNNFNAAEIKLHMPWSGAASTAAMDVDIYYSLLRDTSGIYASATLSHPTSYPLNPGGEWRMAGYPGSTFNWLSVDSLRNKLMALNNDWGTPAAITGAPPENMLLTTGIRKNQYECKYDYSADFGETDAWGWSSTTDHVGLWITTPSKEYYNGGPLKRELMCHGSPTILNMLGGQHYGMGDDGAVQASESWEKTFGPFLIYCNSNTLPAGASDSAIAIALWKDAVAQAKKEQIAWPYSWYTNPSYIQESGRGTITGKLAITDPTAPNASAANMWVGVAAQPANATTTDFQRWSKNYQFWVKTDASGNFTIPHVLPGTYNLYAFGPGAAGQMTMNNFVTVTAGNTSALGTVNWTPTRTAATVWEIGIPDRSAKEFLHGYDWWRSDTVPGNTSPAPNWAKFQDYSTEFPNGVNFTIGQSNTATDWNYVMPYDNPTGSNTPSPVWTINFNLPSDPVAGSTASIYAALAANFSAALIVNVNGTNITTPATGATFANKSDAMIRMGIHGAFADTRISFPASNLHAGANTISFTERITGGATSGDLMFDYVRLEAAMPIVLPVQMLPLQGAKTDKTNVLTWATISEKNTADFKVLRGDKPNPVNAIGTVAAKGNSTVYTPYQFIDNAPLQGPNYYRLQMVDKDGKTSFSNTVLLNITDKNQGIIIYPNPVSSQLLIHSNTAGAAVQSVKLYDAKGGLLYNNPQVATTETTINVSSLPAGVYLIEVRCGDKVVTQRINKQ